MERNRGAMRRTPHAGMPRTQILVGPVRIWRDVQSPALETRTENSLSLGLAMVANACQSKRGLSERRIAVPTTGFV